VRAYGERERERATARIISSARAVGVNISSDASAPNDAFQYVLRLYNRPIETRVRASGRERAHSGSSPYTPVGLKNTISRDAIAYATSVRNIATTRARCMEIFLRDEKRRLLHSFIYSEIGDCQREDEKTWVDQEIFIHNADD